MTNEKEPEYASSKAYEAMKAERDRLKAENRMQTDQLKIGDVEIKILVDERDKLIEHIEFAIECLPETPNKALTVLKQSIGQK